MNKKVFAGVSAVGLVVAGLAGAAVHSVVVEPVVVEKLVPVEVPKLVNVSVPGPVVFQDKVVEKIVSVEDVEFKNMACDRLHYDVVANCVQEVKAEDAALKIAFSQIESDFAQELKDASLVSKSKYAELVKIYTKFEDLSVTSSDYDSGDYSFEIKAKVKDTHEDDKFNVKFTVDVKDGEAKIVDVEQI